MLNSIAIWLIRVLSLVAGAIAAFLLSQSLAGQNLPPGCSAGSGCAEVLTSRWSVVFGIPVSAPATLLYTGVFAATFFVDSSRSAATRRRAWSLLCIAAVAISCSAMWFIAVQALIVQAFCVWCMTDHVIGLLLAAVIFCAEPLVKGSDHDKAPIAIRMRRALVFVIVGTTLTCGFVAAQIVVPYQGPSIARLEPGKNDDTGVGPDRMISIIDGKLALSVHEEPMLGSPDAPKLLAVMFDYCCPHCRRTHEYLVNGLERYPNQIGVITLPLPLDADCNHTIDETESRFEHACELAKLALAVWHADSTAFAEFDRWLFEPEMPREPSEARQKAEELVGAAALDKAISNPIVDDAIARHVQAYQDSGAERIPLIMSPGFASIVGRPESEEELFGLLEKELSLVPQ